MADNLVTIKITGIEKLLKDFDQLDAKTKALIQSELKASAQIIIRNAKRNAPKDMGALAGGVGYKEVTQTLIELFSQLEYSGWQEFGTRRRRKIPPEVQKLGIQFNSGGKSGTAEQALKFITAWVKRKGIRFDSAATVKSGKNKGRNRKLTIEETAWFIFLNIMRTGIKPQPFFFPALFAEVPLLQKRLEMIINNAKL